MGRLRKKPWAQKYLNKSKITFTKPHKFINKWNKKIFINKNQIWIEIGMGKGAFIIKQAEANPNVNFLGIEKYPSVQVIPVKKIQENYLNNLKFISGDAKKITEWFNKESIDKIFINFPDPWPKERHTKRRLLFNTFLNDYYHILKFNGYIEFKTDQLSLFEFALEQIKIKTQFVIKNEIRDLHNNKNINNIIKTEYEVKFSNMGNKIYYVEFHK